MGHDRLRQLRARLHETIGFYERLERDPYEQKPPGRIWGK